MKGIGILFLLSVSFVAGVFAGLYLTGYAPEDLGTLLEDKFGSRVSELLTPAPATPAPQTPLPTPRSAAPVPAPSAGEAKPGTTLEVYDTAGLGLRVRDEPLITPFNIVGKMYEGTKVSVIDGPKAGSGYEWWKIQLQGWVAANWLEPLPSVGRYVRVEGTGELGLRVREQAMIDENIRGKVYDGTRFLIEDGPRASDGYQWWKVKLEGWAATEYLRQPVPSAPIATPTQATKGDLVAALIDLREAMLKKIDFDIDSTATAFTDVKAYWREKRWADIFRVPLRVIEDTLATIATALNWRNIVDQAQFLLDSSDANLQMVSTVMMLQELQEVGEGLQYGLYGPSYVSDVKSMLEAGDATTVPPLGFSHEYYQKVIENRLYGTAEDSPLVIPRKSTTATRRTTEFASGALEVRSAIARKFNDLIREIQSTELPPGLPLDEVIVQLRSLKKEVIRSQSWVADDIRYETYLWDGDKYVLREVETNLGAVGSRYTFFGQVASNLDKRLQIEAAVEVVKVVGAAGNALLIYSGTYTIPGVTEGIKTAQKALVPVELTLRDVSKAFYPDAEDAYYMLPQEMVLALPGELSNLWMIADDTDQYLRYLIGE